jgi:hypothetical protein
MTNELILKGFCILMSIHVLFAIFAGKLIETEVSVVHNQPLIPTSVTYLKGQSHEIFDPWVFSPIKSR